MHDYHIFVSPLGHREVVKQGWSWPAFFFNMFWALAKKLWVLGLSLIFISMFLGAVAPVLIAAAPIINLVISLFFGQRGNSWRINNLFSRGFNHVHTINAASVEGALSAFTTAQNNGADLKPGEIVFASAKKLYLSIILFCVVILALLVLLFV